MSRISIDQAREYLKTVARCDFKDGSFQDYIDNRLAGDFAVEVAEVIKHYRKALSGVRDCVRESVSGSDAYDKACNIVEKAFKRTN